MSVHIGSVSAERAADNRLIHSLNGRRSNVASSHSLAETTEWIQRYIEALYTLNDAH